MAATRVWWFRSESRVEGNRLLHAYMHTELQAFAAAFHVPRLRLHGVGLVGVPGGPSPAFPVLKSVRLLKSTGWSAPDFAAGSDLPTAQTLHINK